MIIWSGKGFLVAVLVFGCSLVANLICNATLGKAYYDNHEWPMALSLVVSAVFCWLLGNYLQRKSDRIAIDKETGEEFVVVRSQHSLFFIPIRYWPLILLMIGLIVFGMELLR